MPKPPNPTLLVYIRSTLQWCVALPVLVFYMSAALVACAIKSRHLDAILHSFCDSICAIFGLKIRTHGLANAPKEPCIFVFNHTNIFDFFACF